MRRLGFTLLGITMLLGCGPTEDSGETGRSESIVATKRCVAMMVNSCHPCDTPDGKPGCCPDDDDESQNGLVDCGAVEGCSSRRVQGTTCGAAEDGCPVVNTPYYFNDCFVIDVYREDSLMTLDDSSYE